MFFNPQEYALTIKGWESYGEAYLPILTDDLPVPLKIIELGVLL